MAWTITKKRMSLGSVNGVMINCTADSAEQEIETGLGLIDGFCLGAKSFSTAGYTFQQNLSSTATAANGTISCSGINSGDNFCIMVFGN